MTKFKDVDITYDKSIENLGSLKGYMHRFHDSTVYPGAFEDSLEEKMYLGLGIGGEAGEVVDVIKKMARLGVPTNRREREEFIRLEDKLFYELGDTFWYIVQLMRVFNWDIKDVLQANIEKLDERRRKNEVKYRD